MEKSVDIYVHEHDMARMERSNSRSHFLCLVLLIVLLATNGAWLYYERSMMMPMESYGMSMGRNDGMSRDNFRDSSFRGGSYGQSYEYSRDNAPMMQRLESMMNEARNDSERQAIKDFVNRM